MTLTIGELCAGYTGLGMGIEAVLDAETAWVADVCKFDKNGNAGHYEPHRSPCTILEHRYPGVPNLGDITKIKWTPDCPECGTQLRAVNNTPGRDGYVYWCPSCSGEFPVSIRPDGMPAPVDILGGGTPCQDLSHAGKRAGMTEGTRSNLWVAMREAIALLRPSLVVWENVGGAASAEADSDLEPCPGCMGDPRDRGPVLRALGRVVGDLSSLGYVGSVRSLRAADVGAPHGRLRYFLAAHPEGDTRWLEHRNRDVAWYADQSGLEGRGNRGRSAGERSARPAGRQQALLPSPRTSDTNGAGQHGDGGLDLRTAVSLLPTPAVNDMGAAYTPDEWDAWTDRMKAEHGNGNGNGKSLAIEAQRLLPSPTAQTFGTQHGNDPTRQTVYSLEAMATKGMLCDDPTAQSQPNSASTTATTAAATGSTSPATDANAAAAWGDYTDAIARWEHTLGRPAPAPTITSAKGNPQLAPAFVEWMMGLPAGWVTDVPDITRNEALKALGNGVVPQQAAAALVFLLDVLEERQAA